MLRYIEYGDYTIGYEIEGDVDGAVVILRSVSAESGSGHLEMFDDEDIADMKFHCKSDFLDKQYAHYMATGEMLDY